MNDFLNILSKYAETFMAPHDLYVYTGATNIEFLKFDENNIVQVNRFVSFSLSPNISYNFTNDEIKCCILKVKIPKGTPIIFISPITNVENEFEFILPIGFKYKKNVENFEETVNFYNITNKDIPHKDNNYDGCFALSRIIPKKMKLYNLTIYNDTPDNPEQYIKNISQYIKSLNINDMYLKNISKHYTPSSQKTRSKTNII
jgi:hypothetical protein